MNKYYDLLGQMRYVQNKTMAKECYDDKIDEFISLLPDNVREKIPSLDNVGSSEWIKIPIIRGIFERIDSHATYLNAFHKNETYDWSELVNEKKLLAVIHVILEDDLKILSTLYGKREASLEKCFFCFFWTVVK